MTSLEPVIKSSANAESVEGDRNELELSYSDTDNPNGACTTRTKTRRQYVKIMFFIAVPTILLLCVASYYFFISCVTRKHIMQDSDVVLRSAELGKLEHALQTERDQSILSLSNLGSKTNTYLLKAYINTDNVLEKIRWPNDMDMKHRPEYRSKAAFKAYLAQHRASIELGKNTIFQEMDFYAKDIRTLTMWLYTSLGQARYSNVWKSLVAYENMISAKELIATERTLGAYFFSNGGFDDIIQYSSYVKQVNVFKSRYSMARWYSDIVPPWNMSTTMAGEDLSQTTENYRHIIKFSNDTEPSLSQAFDWLDKMSLYIDHLYSVQKQIETTLVRRIRGLANSTLIPVILPACLIGIVLLVYTLLVRVVGQIVDDTYSFSMLLVAKNNELSRKKEQTDALFYQMLPKNVAEQFKHRMGANASTFHDVTVLFTNIIGFTRDMPLERDPNEMTKLLNEVNDFFENIIQRFNAYKVETIGEAYMIISGLPQPYEKHCTEIAHLALELLKCASKFILPNLPTKKLHLKIGIHSGSVIAGVVCPTRPRYAVFGRTALIAAYMEKCGQPESIQLSYKAYTSLVKASGNYSLETKESLNPQDRRTMIRSYYLNPRNQSARNQFPTIEVEAPEVELPSSFQDASWLSDEEGEHPDHQTSVHTAEVIGPDSEKDTPPKASPKRADEGDGGAKAAAKEADAVSEVIFL